MSEADNSFTNVTPGRGKKINIVTPGTKHPTRIPRYFRSEQTAQTTLFKLDSEEEEDWVYCIMGGSARNLIQVQTLLPERKPCTQPTTKDVIKFNRELIMALTKCLDPQSNQGYAYIIETEVEYQTRTISKWKQTPTPVRSTFPQEGATSGAWRAYEAKQTVFTEYRHYVQQTLEIIDIMFPGGLPKPNGHLHEKLLPKEAMETIETSTADTVASRQLGNNLIRDVLNRTYTPSLNGPREYFIDSDDDIRISQSIGA